MSGLRGVEGFEVKIFLAHACRARASATPSPSEALCFSFEKDESLVEERSRDSMSERKARWRMRPQWNEQGLVLVRLSPKN